jgi:hypothetical protein
MRCTFFAALLFSATGAMAQTPPPLSENVETTYSQAQREVDESLSRRTVMEVLVPADATEDQYARWKYPICFNVYGLAPVAKYVVERRMKDIATQVGAPIDRAEDCAPNVLIAVTPDQAATLQSIADVRPWLVPGLGMIRSRVREALPVQAWYAIAMQGGYGRRMLVYNGYDYEPQVVPVTSFSRLSSGFETELAAVTTVVDQKAIMGMPLGTLGDYFALLALSQARPSRSCKDFETITNLMLDGCDPATKVTSLSKGDIALLTGLYRTPDDQMARIQRLRIIGNMRRSLEAQLTRNDVPMQ